MRLKELKELHAIHREAARLMLLGWSDKEIGRHLGRSAGWVSNLRKSPLFVEHLEKLQREADEKVLEYRLGLQDEISRLSQKALDVLRSYLEDESGNVPEMPNEKLLKLQADIAKDILDRAGLKSPVTFKDLTERDARDAELARIYEELKGDGDVDE